MSGLSQERCIPCSLGTPPIVGEELKALKSELSDGWEVIEEAKLEKHYKFKDFKSALEFVDKVGAIAEEQGHHPDIELGWGRVVVYLMTHKIHGLSRNDFIMASLIDAL